MVGGVYACVRVHAHGVRHVVLSHVLSDVAKDTYGLYGMALYGSPRCTYAVSIEC